MVGTKWAGSNSAKAGLNHFVRHLAREEAHNGIRANLVAPGGIVSEDSSHLCGLDPNTKEGSVQNCDQTILKEKLSVFLRISFFTFFSQQVFYFLPSLLVKYQFHKFRRIKSSN